MYIYRDGCQRTEITPIFSNYRAKIFAIFGGIFIIFWRYFKTVMYLLHYFSRNPKRCAVEPCLRNTGLEDRQWFFESLQEKEVFVLSESPPNRLLRSPSIQL